MHPYSLEDHQHTLDNLREAQKRTSMLCAVFVALGGNGVAIEKRMDVKMKYAAGQTVKLVPALHPIAQPDVLPLGTSTDLLASFQKGDVITVMPHMSAAENVHAAQLVVDTVSKFEVGKWADKFLFY